MASSSHLSLGRGHHDSPELSAYINANFVREPAALSRISQSNSRAGLPAWQISPWEGQILEFLTRAARAQKAVEVGTLGGYSSAWIARGLAPGGRMYTLENDPRHARVARANFKKVGLAGKIRVIEGDARASLLLLEREGPFDFCFIDADKEGYSWYAAWAGRNLRPGGILAADNAYLFGQVHAKAEHAGPGAGRVKSMQDTLRMMTKNTLFKARAIIPSGEGLAVAIKS